ncbi:MAG: DUF2264 domain-containing protein [Lachnospiraceae bacterium]|nr:DUF2264 domain-containing protein [Lachnospiraceae bacterium]
MAFKPTTTDYNLSPFTGLTRESWLEAAEYLMSGIFSNIPDIEAPVVMPRYETKVTYPHEGDPEWRYKAEIFEGLTRSFFIAAPLIKNKPDVTLNGICLREYYRKQVLCAVTQRQKNYVFNFTDMKKMVDPDNPEACFQQTVETAALVICLWMSREEIWDTYSKAEKDRIAAFLYDFAISYTVPQNWRLFNMLDLAFLYMNGYEIDENIMRDHAQTILNYYAGDGWYRDGQCFDYYSCWAFNMYTAIWNNWYGYEKEPYIAKRYEENSNKLMENYPTFFDRDGFTNMWGRSCIYRNASTSAFDGNMLMKESNIDHGFARRICSGSLMQFLGRDDFLINGVPALGFYGPFSPLVQGYSCAESPLWLGKAFLCLCLPGDHPFWTATETEGFWTGLGPAETKETVLDGPALCTANHAANGITELRTAKVVKDPHDLHGMENYSKLVFNTKFPWEAQPAESVRSQEYSLGYGRGDILSANVTFWHGYKDGVLYRRQFFDYDLKTETHWKTALNLADFSVPYGILRADRIRLYRYPSRLSLGAFGFPDNGTEVKRLEKDGCMAFVLKGKDSTGRPKQLAFTAMDGWSGIGLAYSRGTNPDSDASIIAYAYTDRTKQYGCGQSVLISQVITKESTEDFTEDEIFPIKTVNYTDPEGRGGYGPVEILLKDGTRRIIDFEGIEGTLSL